MLSHKVVNRGSSLSMSSSFLKQVFRNESTILSRLQRPTRYSIRLLSSQSELKDAGVARVFYEDDQPKLSLRLPKAGAVSLLLRPNMPVAALLQQIKEEERLADDVALQHADGYRIAKSTLVDDALQSEIDLVVGNSKYTLSLPTIEERTASRRGQLVALKKDLALLENLKYACDTKASRISNLLVWGGLGGLFAQWTLMMRLTWWEYSWDVMEPIAYFVGFFGVITGYTFYVVTRREFTYENLADYSLTRRQLKYYSKAGLDLIKYNALREAISKLERDIIEIESRAAEKEQRKRELLSF